jgi:hypothetical protein
MGITDNICIHHEIISKRENKLHTHIYERQVNYSSIGYFNI